MSEYVTTRPGIPLATKGYVSAVNDRFIQQTVLSDGTVTPANLNLSEMRRLAFSLQHGIVRMSLRSIGGINQTVRSQATAINISSGAVRLGVRKSGLSLNISKN